MSAITERARRYREKHRALINARAVAAYRADPQKFRERALRYQRKDPASYRAKRRKWRGGLPAPTRPEPTCCELCGRDVLFCARGLHLDHDHETGKFRGWLCGDCNTGLGKLGDNIQGLRRAIEYLEYSAWE